MDIMILLGSKSDFPLCEDGIKLLQEWGIAFDLHIASAHRSPAWVHELVQNFDQSTGKVCIAVAGKSAHLAGVVAALTCKPVLAVPIYTKETAGLDALLSMSQMPQGVPVATMGFGNSGFANACLLALQIMALSDKQLAAKLAEHRKGLTRKVLTDDAAIQHLLGRGEGEQALPQ